MSAPSHSGHDLHERFRIVRCIGAGGAGVVYEAEDMRARRRVALKTLKEVSGQGVYRLKKEFRSLADVRHPNLIRLGELHHARGQWFFTMDLIDGVSILDHVRREPDSGSGGSGLDEPRLRKALRQLVAGLRGLHDAGKVHRDIKPSNVMVDDDGKLVLLDFGLVGAIDPIDSLVSDGGTVGTVLYMAPEQAAGHKPAPAADWYGMGVLLFEALTGEVPFKGRTLLEVLADKQRVVRPESRHLGPGVPPDLLTLAVELMHPDPAERPSLENIAQRVGATDDRASRPPRASWPVSGGPRFVGRGAELRILDGALTEAVAGRLRTVIVRGSSGIGKSALVERFLSTCSHDPLILRGRCYERETVPYKAFDGVVDALGARLRRMPDSEVGFVLTRDVALLARLFPTLDRVPSIERVTRQAGGENHVATDELCRRAYRAFGQLLTALAEARPVVLTIDDLHLADADSFRMLEAVLAMVAQAPVLFVATVRTDNRLEHLLEGTTTRRWATIFTGDLTLPNSSDAPDVDRMLEHLDVVHVDLLGLAEEEAGELARVEAAAAGLSLAGRAPSIAREAGGNPLFVVELVQRLAAVDDDEPPSSVTVENLIWSRVGQLDEPARRLLEIVAVAGAPLARSIVVRAARLGHDAAEQAVSKLEDDKLVQTRLAHGVLLVEPQHGRIRETVMRHLSAAKQRRHHAALAKVIEVSEQGSSRLLVHHLGGAGYRAQAAKHALSAAESAVQSMAFDQAAEYFLLACRFGDLPADELARVRLARARCLRDAGRGNEAAGLFLEVAASTEPPLRDECRSEAAMQLLAVGNIPDGLQVLGDVLEARGERRAPRALWLELSWLRAKLRLRGLSHQPRRASDLPAATLAEIDMHRDLGAVLSFVDPELGGVFHLRGLHRALDAEEPMRIGLGLAAQAVYVSARGRKSRSRGEEFLRAARDCQQHSEGASLSVAIDAARAFMRYFEGAFAEAAEQLADVEVRARMKPMAGRRLGLPNLRLFRLLALRHLGDPRETMRLTDGWLADAVARDDRYMQTSLSRALNVRWLIEDQPAEALARLDGASWPPPDAGYHLQHHYDLVARIELALYRARATKVVEAIQQPLAGYLGSSLPELVSCRVTMAWLRARLELALAVEGQRPPDSKWVERLTRDLDREGLAPTRAWSLLVRAGAANLVGDTMQTLELLAAAEAHCEAQAMTCYAQVARMRRGQVMQSEAGAALVADASRWLRQHGVVSPERYADLYGPGFATAQLAGAAP